MTIRWEYRTKLVKGEGNPSPFLYKLHFENCPAPAPSPSSRFGPPAEVKERLHRSALHRLSGLPKALPLFLLQRRNIVVQP